MARSATLLTALAIASAAHAAPAAPADLKVGEQVQAAIEPFRPEIEALAQLMYVIGACELHLNSGDTNYYIKTFMSGPAPAGLSGVWVRETQDIYAQRFTAGRNDAERLNYDQPRCQQEIADQIERAKATIAKRIRLHPETARP